MPGPPLTPTSHPAIDARTTLHHTQAYDAMARAFERGVATVADLSDKDVYDDAFFGRLGDIDLLITSIPCVGFSNLGKREGLQHEPTALFVRSLWRFIRRAQPKLLVRRLAECRRRSPRHCELTSAGWPPTPARPPCLRPPPPHCLAQVFECVGGLETASAAKRAAKAAAAAAAAACVGAKRKADNQEKNKHGRRRRGSSSSSSSSAAGALTAAGGAGSGSDEDEPDLDTNASDLECVLAPLEEAGYGFYWSELKGHKWCAPVRTRLFIIGYRLDCPAALGAFNEPVASFQLAAEPPCRSNSMEQCLLPPYSEEKYDLWLRSGLSILFLPCAPAEVYSRAKMAKKGHPGTQSKRFVAAEEMQLQRGKSHSKVGVHHRKDEISCTTVARGSVSTLARSTSRAYVMNDERGPRTLTGLEAARAHGYPEGAIEAYYAVRSHDQVQSDVGDGFTIPAVSALLLRLLQKTGFLPDGKRRWGSVVSSAAAALAPAAGGCIDGCSSGAGSGGGGSSGSSSSSSASKSSSSSLVAVPHGARGGRQLLLLKGSASHITPRLALAACADAVRTAEARAAAVALADEKRERDAATAAAAAALEVAARSVRERDERRMARCIGDGSRQ